MNSRNGEIGGGLKMIERKQAEKQSEVRGEKLPLRASMAVVSVRVLEASGKKMLPLVVEGCPTFPVRVFLLRSCTVRLHTVARLLIRT